MMITVKSCAGVLGCLSEFRRWLKIAYGRLLAIKIEICAPLGSGIESSKSSAIHFSLYHHVLRKSHNRARCSHAE